MAFFFPEFQIKRWFYRISWRMAMALERGSHSPVRFPHLGFISFVVRQGPLMVLTWVSSSGLTSQLQQRDNTSFSCDLRKIQTRSLVSVVHLVHPACCIPKLDTVALVWSCKNGSEVRPARTKWMEEEGEVALGLWGRGRVMCMLRYVCLCSRTKTTSSVVPWVPNIALWRQCFLLAWDSPSWVDKQVSITLALRL